MGNQNCSICKEERACRYNTHCHIKLQYSINDGSALTCPQVYYNSGTIHVDDRNQFHVYPRQIECEEKVEFCFRIRSNSIIGPSGVISYKIDNPLAKCNNNYLNIMWSNPFNLQNNQNEFSVYIGPDLKATYEGYNDLATNPEFDFFRVKCEMNNIGRLKQTQEKY